MYCFAPQTVLILVLTMVFHVGQALRCACTMDLNKCASIHETPADFKSAQVSCETLGGELMQAGAAASNDTIAALLSGASGSFWTGLETKGKERCLSVSSGKKWTEKACRGKLDGFICAGVRWHTCWAKMTTQAILLNDGDCSLGPCEHICDNVRNGYACTCMGDFKPALKDPRCCEYYCLTPNCESLCTPGSGCVCPTGFVEDDDGKTCTDMDECGSNHDCMQICTNTLGSYECSCRKDYILVNGTECVLHPDPWLPPPTAAGTPFISPALNYTSGRVSLAGPGEYVGIAVFIFAALVGLVLLVRYLRTRKTDESLKDCDVLDDTQQAL